MSLRSPMGRVLGLGSAKNGTSHWWSQRMTALALIPLTLWFTYTLVSFDRLDYAGVIAWIHVPWNAIALSLLVVVLMYHSMLGVQVVVEDYVHTGWRKVTTITLLNFTHIVLGAAGVFSVLRIAFGDRP